MDFKFFPAHKNSSKLIKIYVGGAFEEDERVSKMKSAIEWCKQELNTPLPRINDTFMPDTSTSRPPDEDELLKQLDPNELQKLKTETRLDDEENIRKNDILLVELRKEYETLVNRVNERRRLQNRPPVN